MSPWCKYLLPFFLLPVLACAPKLTSMDMSNLFEKGVASYEAGDFQTALQHWRPLAENNDLAALRNIGHLYRRGLGVERDPQKAANYYLRAAELGFAPAQFNLAMMQLSGDGIAANREEGSLWMQAAADQNYQPAVVWVAYQNREVTLFENREAQAQPSTEDETQD
jgi:TPR repeat protein